MGTRVPQGLHGGRCDSRHEALATDESFEWEKRGKRVMWNQIGP